MVAKLFLLCFLIHYACSITLDCNFNSDTEWAVVGFAYTCHGKFIQVDDVRSVVAVTGNHTDAMTHQNVTGLFVNTDPIDYIPEGIGQFFENIDYIYFRHTPIKSLTKEDLKPFPKLKIFGVAGGQLTTLRGDVLEYLPDLVHMSASNNSITNIGPGLFQHLPELHTIHLQDNLCIDRQTRNITVAAEIIKELAFRCPPTVEMTEEIILGGENFREAVIVQLDPELQILSDRIRQLEDENNQLNDRVARLESVILSMAATREDFA